jgi:hypothetical protein
MKFEPRKVVNVLVNLRTRGTCIKVNTLIYYSKCIKSSVQFQHLICQFVMSKFVYFLFRLYNCVTARISVTVARCLRHCQDEIESTQILTWFGWKHRITENLHRFTYPTVIRDVTIICFETSLIFISTILLFKLEMLIWNINVIFCSK